MARDRDEGVLGEIERITLAEGMVEFCRDLRDSMTFYDRDVLLATYTGMLESMIITALYQAGCQGKVHLAATADRLQEVLRQLPERLSPPPGPLDIESFLQRFLEVGARGLLETYSVYWTTLTIYFTEPAEIVEDPDVRLYRAYRGLRTGQNGAMESLGRVGAAFLRGASLSAGWLRLEGARAEAVQCLWTLRDTVWSTPGGGRGQRVLDFEAERAARRGFEPSPLSVTADDRFWEALWSDAGPQSEDLAYAQSSSQVVVWPLRALLSDDALAAAADDGDPALLHVAQTLAQLAPDLASDGLVETLARLDADSPAFVPLSEYLSGLGAEGTRAVAGYIRDAKDVPSAVRLAPLLVRRRGRVARDRTVFEVLADLLVRASWADGKERVATALAEFGDARAVPLLERELTAVEPRTYYQEQVVRRALTRLASGRRGGGSSAGAPSRHG